MFKGKWRGHHEVAIKQLTCFADEMLLSALEREIGILKRVSFNRNIVQFYGFCLEVEAPMLVRDFHMFGHTSQVGRRRCIRRPLLCTLGWYCNPRTRVHRQVDLIFDATDIKYQVAELLNVA